MSTTGVRWTSMGKNKRYNRKSEQMYEQLETLGVMAELKAWNILPAL